MYHECLAYIRSLITLKVCILIDIGFQHHHLGTNHNLVNSPHPASPRYGLVVSDTTGNYPNEGTTAERLAFLFRWSRVHRTEVASDITYDRTRVCNTLYEHRKVFWEAFDKHEKDLKRTTKPKPTVPNPQFLTFIRQPLCVSFETGDVDTKKPYRFLAVNCHLLYGKDPAERRREFYALISWLVDRAKNPERMYYKNIILMGDCNLDFRDPDKDKLSIDELLKSLNKKELGKKGNAEINFPFLDAHPILKQVLTTSTRQKDTYDQIAMVFRDPWFPDYKKNLIAGTAPDGYDYGVFNFMDVIANALRGSTFNKLDKKRQKELIGKTQFKLSDHLPIWIRLPILD
jgi:hypothetical protein